MKYTLTAADYWKLRALISENQRIGELVVSARERAATAQQRQNAFLLELAAEHGFDPHGSGVYLDDEACSLTISEVLADQKG